MCARPILIHKNRARRRVVHRTHWRPGPLVHCFLLLFIWKTARLYVCRSVDMIIISIVLLLVGLCVCFYLGYFFLPVDVVRRTRKNKSRRRSPTHSMASVCLTYASSVFHRPPLKMIVIALVVGSAVSMASFVQSVDSN